MASCSDFNTKYVKKAVRIMDKNGVYAQGPEWEQAKLAALEAHPTTLEEAQEIVIQAGQVAGGKHTFLMTSNEVTKNDTSVWEMPMMELLEEGVAVIKLPPFSGNEAEGIKYANAVLNALPDALNGVIIDLRGNRGGNMYPMISSVHRFLPDDIILRLRTRRYNMEINVDYVLSVAKIARETAIDCPVALLTDEWTGSSGEAVLLCFRGLENTRTFGSPTSGYASCNQPFKLSDGSLLVLTTGTDVARTGEVFCDDPIQPDVLTETPLEDALGWLENQAKAWVADEQRSLVLHLDVFDLATVPGIDDMKHIAIGNDGGIGKLARTFFEGEHIGPMEAVVRQGQCQRGARTELLAAFLARWVVNHGEPTIR